MVICQAIVLGRVAQLARNAHHTPASFLANTGKHDSRKQAKMGASCLGRCLGGRCQVRQVVLSWGTRPFLRCQVKFLPAMRRADRNAPVVSAGLPRDRSRRFSSGPSWGDGQACKRGGTLPSTTSGVGLDSPLPRGPRRGWQRALSGSCVSCGRRPYAPPRWTRPPVVPQGCGLLPLPGSVPSACVGFRIERMQVISA